MKCRSCASEIPDGARTCPSCEVAIMGSSPRASGRKEPRTGSETLSFPGSETPPVAAHDPADRPGPEIQPPRGLRRWSPPELPERPYPVRLPYTHPARLAGRDREQRQATAPVAVAGADPRPVRAVGGGQELSAPGRPGARPSSTGAAGGVGAPSARAGLGGPPARRPAGGRDRRRQRRPRSSGLRRSSVRGRTARRRRAADPGPGSVRGRAAAAGRRSVAGRPGGAAGGYGPTPPGPRRVAVPLASGLPPGGPWRRRRLAAGRVARRRARGAVRFVAVRSLDPRPLPLHDPAAAGDAPARQRSAEPGDGGVLNGDRDAARSRDRRW